MIKITETIPPHPEYKIIKNKRTKKEYQCARWGVNYRLVYKKDNKLRSTFKTVDEVNRLFYIQDEL